MLGKIYFRNDLCVLRSGLRSVHTCFLCNILFISMANCVQKLMASSVMLCFTCNNETLFKVWTIDVLMFVFQDLYSTLRL